MVGDDKPKPAAESGDKTLLTPGEVAELAALGKFRDYLTRTMEDVGNERSGQLSPSHTPGRHKR